MTWQFLWTLKNQQCLTFWASSFAITEIFFFVVSQLFYCSAFSLHNFMGNYIASGIAFVTMCTLGFPLHKSALNFYQRLCQFIPHLYSLAKTLKRINIQTFLAGLQTGNHFLTLDFAWPDSETSQAAVEILSKSGLGDFTSCKKENIKWLLIPMRKPHT